MSNEKMTGRFNRNTAKETEEQSMAFDSPADGSGIEIKSPGTLAVPNSRLPLTVDSR